MTRRGGVEKVEIMIVYDMERLTARSGGGRHGDEQYEEDDKEH